MPPPLKDEHVGALVDKYQRERDRFAKMSGLVQRYLQAALFGHRIRAVVTSRAKDGPSLHGKLRKDANSAEPKFSFEELSLEFGPHILDLAGARVLLYEFERDSEAVVRIIEELFGVSAEERFRRDHGLKDHRCYQARHRVVTLRPEQLQEPERENLAGVLCEVQVVSLVKHIWNELEHDIKYKDAEGLGEPDDDQKAWLEVLWDSLQAAQTAAAHLSRATDLRRARKKADGAPIETADELLLAMGLILGRPFGGNVQRLFDLLDGTENSLSASTIKEKIGVRDAAAIERGRELAKARGHAADDDAEAVVALLWEDRGEDFAEIASSWRGPTSSMRRFIDALAGGATAPADEADGGELQPPVEGLVDDGSPAGAGTDAVVAEVK